jgi:hypothetical protein
VVGWTTSGTAGEARQADARSCSRVTLHGVLVAYRVYFYLGRYTPPHRQKSSSALQTFLQGQRHTASPIPLPSAFSTQTSAPLISHSTASPPPQAHSSSRPRPRPPPSSYPAPSRQPPSSYRPDRPQLPSPCPPRPCQRQTPCSRPNSLRRRRPCRRCRSQRRACCLGNSVSHDVRPLERDGGTDGDMGRDREESGRAGHILMPPVTDPQTPTPSQLSPTAAHSQHLGCSYETYPSTAAPARSGRPCCVPCCYLGCSVLAV